MARHDFSKATRHVIAARAGYRCSYPGCYRLTLGPAAASDTFEDTGFASHIHSASDNGPRGPGELTPVQLKHASNGIWMCGDHESLIDKNNGSRFPVHLLQSWKALHEYRTSYEHSGDQAAFGFVRTLKLERSPLFMRGTQIDLAKTTFLIGANGSGKSALCEWLSVLETGGNVRRWLTNTDVDYTITFDAPAEHRLRVRTEGLLTLNLDGKAVSRNHARSSAIYLRGRGDNGIACDLRRIMVLLGIEEFALRSLGERVLGHFVTRLEFVKRVQDEEDDEEGEQQDHHSDEPSYRLECHLAQGSVMSYGQLSGGEQGRVLLELAMALALEGTQFGPTLLIVELKSIGMDWVAIQPYLAHFASSECLYQTVVTSWELPNDVEMLGWQIYLVDGQPGEPGTITASPRG